MKNILFCFLFLMMCTGCQKEILPSKEDFLEMALDTSNVEFDEVVQSNIEIKEEKYFINFDTNTGHYEYIYEKDGTLIHSSYNPILIEKEIEEEKSELSQEEKERALEVACINMGISISDPQNVEIKLEEDSIVARFNFGEEVTYVTIIDPVSFTVTSSFTES